MENPEEILHSLEEFSKMKPKDIPRELEEYLCYVAKTGNPVYQWNTIKSLFREKLLNVITEFYEACPAVDIPPCPNVEVFNYELMKNFILEKLDNFASAPFTVQRICELLTTPRKEYNRIDKYMRALEKNILVVSTTEPGRRSTENGESIVNGLESDHSENLAESSDSNHDINVEEMDDSPSRPRTTRVFNLLLDNSENENQVKVEEEQISVIQENFENESEEKTDVPSSSTVIDPPEHIQQETVISCQVDEESEQSYVPVEPVPSDADQEQETIEPSLETKDLSSIINSNQETNGEEDNSEEVKEEDMKTLNEVNDEETKEADVLQPDETSEEVLTRVTCSESVDETQIEKPNTEEDDLLEEATTSESIMSPKTDSSEAIHVEISSEAEKNEAETTSRPEEELPEESKEAEEPKDEENTEIVSSDIKEIENDVQDTENERCNKHSEVEVENVVDSSTSFEEMTENQDKSPKMSPVPEEIPSEAEEAVPPVDSSENETTNEALVSKPSENIPMEVDIISETETDKKIVTDEPSSTSADISL